MLSDFSSASTRPTDDQLHTAICECGNPYYTDAIHVWTKCGWCKEIDKQVADYRGTLYGVIGLAVLAFVVAFIFGPNP